MYLYHHHYHSYQWNQFQCLPHLYHKRIYIVLTIARSNLTMNQVSTKISSPEYHYIILKFVSAFEKISDLIRLFDTDQDLIRIWI